MCPAGAAMLPTSITGAATREPSAAWVHTNVPRGTSVTRTDPLGVAIIVESARQIGQLGAPVALREPTVTTPSTRTVPLTISYAALPVFDRTRPDGPAGGDGKQHQRGGKPHLNEMTAAEQFGNEPDRGTKRNPEPY